VLHTAPMQAYKPATSHSAAADLAANPVGSNHISLHIKQQTPKMQHLCCSLPNTGLRETETLPTQRYSLLLLLHYLSSALSHSGCQQRSTNEIEPAQTHIHMKLQHLKALPEPQM
jgi:hypothetical protein